MLHTRTRLYELLALLIRCSRLSKCFVHARRDDYFGLNTTHQHPSPSPTRILEDHKFTYITEMGRKIMRERERAALRAQRKSQQYSAAPTRLQINQDPSQPREEHHYHDFYPDLDEDEPLPVFINDPSPNETINHIQDVSESHANGHHNHHHDDHHQQQQNNMPLPSSLNKPTFKQIPKEILPNDNSKIPKNIMKLGYKTDSLSKVTDTYIRGNNYFVQREQNNVFFDSISKNQMNFKSMYDMDEQDNYYLAYLNDIRPEGKPLSHELLEIAITILENEWYHLERKIPPKIRKTFSETDQMSMKASAAMAFTERYGSDDGIGSSPHEEQPCAVCNESDCDNSNAIIFCDGCDIAVHQDCYGVIFIPEGQWLCRRCMVSKKRKIRCQFCPSTTGAFKQTANGRWSHVLCGLWIPELYFASAGHMEPIEGIESIPKGRWSLVCYICKQKMGACIQCANRSCFTAFHPTCAKRAMLSMTMTKGVQGAVLDKSTMAAYCHKHSPPNYNQEHDVKADIERARLYFSTIGSTDHEMQQSFKVDKGKEIKNKNKKLLDRKRWKTVRGTPIPPNYFITVLELFFGKLKIKDGSSLAQNIVKYWTMKREMKRGAPLIRRTDATVYSAGNPEKIPEKIKFSERLLKDISSLEEIGQLLIRKANVELERHLTETEMVKTAYFAHNMLIKGVLDRMVKVDSSKLLMAVKTKSLNLAQISDKVNGLQYESVDEFIGDLEAFFEETESVDVPELRVAARRVMREVYDLIEGIRTIDKNELDLDFVVDGLKITPVDYRGRNVMKENDLSDVE